MRARRWNTFQETGERRKAHVTPASVVECASANEIKSGFVCSRVTLGIARLRVLFERML
jgi:hypothetical protein